MLAGPRPSATQDANEANEKPAGNSETGGGSENNDEPRHQPSSSLGKEATVKEGVIQRTLKGVCGKQSSSAGFDELLDDLYHADQKAKFSTTQFTWPTCSSFNDEWDLRMMQDGSIRRGFHAKLPSGWQPSCLTNNAVYSYHRARFSNTSRGPSNHIEVLNMWDKIYKIGEIFVDDISVAEQEGIFKKDIHGRFVHDDIHPSQNQVRDDKIVVKKFSDFKGAEWVKKHDKPIVLIFTNPKVFRDARWRLFACVNQSIVINATGCKLNHYVQLEVPHKDLIPMVKLQLSKSMELWDITNEGKVRRLLFQKRIVVPESSAYMAITYAFILLFCLALVGTVFTTEISDSCHISLGIRDNAAISINPDLDSGLMTILLVQTLICYHLFYNSATSVDPSVNIPKYSDTISDLFKEDKVIISILYSILLVYSNIVRSRFVDPDYMEFFVRFCFVQLFCINATFMFSVSGSPFKTLIHFLWVACFCVMTLFNIMLTGEDEQLEYTCRVVAFFCTFICLFLLVQVRLTLKKESKLRRMLVPLSLASETMVLISPFYVMDELDDRPTQLGIAIIAVICILVVFDVIIMINDLYRGCKAYVNQDW